MSDLPLPLPLSALIVGLITMGAAVMSLAIFKTRKIISWLNQGEAQADGSMQTPRSWQYLSILMVFFLGGYCLAVFLIASQAFEWLPLLTGTVFFFGALFVLFSVSVYTRTLHQLMATQVSYRDERDRTSETLVQLQKTQMLLVHNEKMLSLGQLSAGIAHEINNPISFIHGNLRHLRQYASDLFSVIKLYEDTDSHTPAEITELKEDIELEFIKDDIDKILGSMQTGTGRIRQIVDSMRNFSRLDESQRKKADLIEGLESSLVLLQSRLTDNSRSPRIEVRKNYSTLPMVDCDHSAVNQVFLHLLNNAIDALSGCSDISPNGLCQISITARQLNDQWVQVAIADNGVGISQQDLHHVFDPFFTTKPIGKGTGLGLSMSHQIIVEQHKGHLLCHSELGKGTEFTIQLPIVSTAVLP
ncbi:MAG: ATP-binding protein [Cyanobacteria bacterium J06634_5]